MWVSLGNKLLLKIFGKSKREEWSKFGVTTKRLICCILYEMPLGIKWPILRSLTDMSWRILA